MSKDLEFMFLGSNTMTCEWEKFTNLALDSFDAKRKNLGKIESIGN